MDVTAGTASLSGIADAAQRHVLPGCYARWDVDGNLALFAQPTFATALLAWRLDDRAFALACRAWRDGHELAEERTLRTAHLAAAVARRACLRFRSRFRTAAGAPVARLEQLGVDLLFDAHRDFGECERDRHLDVRARAYAPAGAPAAEAEHFVQTRERAEVAHEDAERLGEIHVVEARSASAEPGFAVTVICRALLWIAQDVVGLRDLLEFLFGVLCPVIPIGVVLHRELTVRLLDVVVRRATGHAENHIKISHAAPSKRLLLE